MTRSQETMSPDPFCTMCGGDGWVAGGSHMGDVERIPCECIGRHDDDEEAACPNDPDGLHHVGCGCDDKDEP